MLNICKDIRKLTVYILSEKVKITNLKLEMYLYGYSFLNYKKIKEVLFFFIIVKTTFKIWLFSWWFA